MMVEYMCKSSRRPLRFSGFLKFLAVSMSVLVFSGAPASGQSLKETLELTYRTNPTLKAQRASLRATDELAAQARAGRRPSINGQYSYSVSDGTYDSGLPATPGGANDIFSSFGGDGQRERQQAAVELKQPIFTGFKTRNSIKEAAARISAAQADLIGVEQDVLASAVAAYMSVVTNEESVRASEASLRFLEQRRAAALASFRAGQATRTDTAQAEARYASAEADLIRARSDLAGARNQFSRIVGQMPATLEAQLALPPLPESLETVEAVALSRNPTLLAAKGRLKAAEHQIKVVKGNLLPSISANASYSYGTGQFIDGDESTSSALGLQLTVPLFQGGATYSAVRQAKEARNAEGHGLEATERAVREQARVAWDRLNAARAALAATESAITATELAQEGLVLENRVGQRTVLDVLDGERELLNTRLAKFQAREQYYLSAFGLMQVMGTLTAADLGLDVAAYDPDRNRHVVQNKWIGFGSSVVEDW